MAEKEAVRSTSLHVHYNSSHHFNAFRGTKGDEVKLVFTADETNPTGNVTKRKFDRRI